MPEIPPQDDPIVGRRMNLLILVSTLLLMLTVAWSLYGEFFGLRPWRGYQDRFRSVYSAYLDKEIQRRQGEEQAVYTTPEYQRLKAAAESAVAAAAPANRQIQTQIELLDRQRAAMMPAFQIARGEVGALTYELEQTSPSNQGAKEAKLAELNEARARTYEVEWPGETGSAPKSFNYDSLTATFTNLMSTRASLVARRGELDGPAREAQAQIDQFLKERLAGLSSADLSGLAESVRNMVVRLRQINVNPPGTQLNYAGGVGLVDRCQSCHMATDPLLVPPVMQVTKASLGLGNNNDAPFASHPNPDLLKFHPLEKFGCSPCHGGNGRALESEEKAHGRYEHWLWPLAYPENYEAGCQQCHAADMRTSQATVLNQGKELYREKGCIGCHKFQGFDNEDDLLIAARQQILQLETERAQSQLEIPRLNRLGDQAPNNEAANRYYRQATNLTVAISNLDAKIEQLDRRSHSLLQELKKVGPNLKDVRLKLRKEWIPYWLTNTHQFRPNTKMPQFRLQPNEVQAISAFIWQSGLEGPAPPAQAPGNAPRGKQLLETRGCLACHSVGEGTSMVGGTFAANLSRVGEKDNYDYLVRWIRNPRERTRPYSHFEKRDLGPEDYARHGLPFVFDLEHSRSPNDGHELVVQQATVMPNFRLSIQESRDIASYLLTQKHADARYEAAPFMDDPNLKEQGRSLVRLYGCAGCHEIATMEDEGRVGTELTNEGSKPTERLDFALLTENAKRGILPNGKRSPRGPWYDAKGFFEQKLADPAIFDTGKYKPNPIDRLRMPKPNVNASEISALVTMMLGSTDPSLPPDYMYKPSDQRASVQKGWWIVTKYNCMGCHQIDAGQDTVLMGLPMYQGENRINLPPVLTSEGARANPEWIKRFLANPALSTTDTNRNGVRNYLEVRMPTFHFSDDEIRSLVLFFDAISHQAQPFIPESLPPLSPAELAAARSIFTSPAAPCLRCHATGDPVRDRNATAPNFLLAQDRLRPAWTQRFITNPQLVIPGTAMPSGLFQRVNNRWIFAGQLPPAVRNYTGDHASLLVRYLFQLSPQEQRMLIGSTPAGAPGSN